MEEVAAVRVLRCFKEIHRICDVSLEEVMKMPIISTEGNTTVYGFHRAGITLLALVRLSEGYYVITTKMVCW